MSFFFFLQAEGGIRNLVRSRGLGDVYKRQARDRRQGGHEPGRAVAPLRVQEATAGRRPGTPRRDQHGLLRSELPRRAGLHARSAAARGAQPLRCAACLLYTSDAADERASGDLGGRRIIKKKNSAKT